MDLSIRNHLALMIDSASAAVKGAAVSSLSCEDGASNLRVGNLQAKRGLMQLNHIIVKR